MTIKEADQLLKDREETCLFADGLEDAFIGIGYQVTTPIAIYSTKKVIASLMKQDMDFISAVEYFDYNIIGAYVGEATPIFFDDMNS
jgi:hypothetical protein